MRRKIYFNECCWISWLSTSELWLVFQFDWLFELKWTSDFYCFLTKLSIWNQYVVCNVNMWCLNSICFVSSFFTHLYVCCECCDALKYCMRTSCLNSLFYGWLNFKLQIMQLSVDDLLSLKPECRDICIASLLICYYFHCQAT